MTTVAIQIDACRRDYIHKSDTPFLYFLKETCLSGTLMPTFGFEPDAAYLAGLYPDECDGGMHFWYSPETSVFKATRFLPKFLDTLPSIAQLILRRLLKMYIKQTSKFSRVKHVPHSCRIPFSLMPYFDIAEKNLFTDEDFVNGKSIFSILRNNGKSFFFHGAPTHSADSTAVLKGLKNANHSFDFIFLHIGDLDSVGHKYGPESVELSSGLRKVDGVLEEIWACLHKRYERVNAVIFGDHGMVKVNELIDIKTILKALNLEIGKDYVYFLDSTLARFWFFNERAKQLVLKALEKVEQGRFLTQEDKDKYHLNYPHNKFGDLIFLADPGVLIFPNFWNNSIPEKGMHGYIPEYPGQQSEFIIYNSISYKSKHLDNPIDMRRVYKEIIKLCNMD